MWVCVHACVRRRMCFFCIRECMCTWVCGCVVVTRYMTFTVQSCTCTCTCTLYTVHVHVQCTVYSVHNYYVMYIYVCVWECVRVRTCVSVLCENVLFGDIALINAGCEVPCRWENGVNRFLKGVSALRRASHWARATRCRRESACYCCGERLQGRGAGHSFKLNLIIIIYCVWGRHQSGEPG